jgi:hypothetical protein
MYVFPQWITALFSTFSVENRRTFLIVCHISAIYDNIGVQNEQASQIREGHTYDL